MTLRAAPPARPFRGKPAWRTIRPLAATSAALLCLAAPLGVRGQSDSSAGAGPIREFRNSPPPLPDTEPVANLPSEAYADNPAIGVPAQDLFRNTRAVPLPNSRAFLPAPSLQSESFRDQVSLEAPTFSANFPLLQRGFAPENADLKFGPIYFKLNAISTAVEASDNINLTEKNRESGVIAIGRISGTIIAQLTEGLHFVASGSFVYLPLQGDFGFGGPASRLPYSLGLAAIPAIQSQASWDTVFFGQPFLIADDFRTGIGRYSFSTYDDFDLFAGDEFNGEDREGRLAFRLPSHPETDTGPQNRDLQSEFSYFSNDLSVSADRLLPGDIQMHVRAFQENLWYNQGRRGLPDLRDGTNLLLREVGENVRFKPFLSYDTLYTSVSDSFNQILRLGVVGPVTDQLDLRADVGFLYTSRDSNERLLFDLMLKHDAGPYTREFLYFDRTVDDFQDEINTRVTYNLRQILGPKLTADLFTTYGRVDDLLGVYHEWADWRSGLQLEFQLGPRTELQLSGIYAKLTHDPDGDENTNTFTLRADLTHRFSDTLYGRLLYQYQSRGADEELRSYYENLVFLSITKYFK